MNGNMPDLTVQPHEGSQINKVIAVISGKGGVGKSLVTSMLAVMMKRKGYHTAILDADITGPSIPKAFGVSGMAQGSEAGLYPMKTSTGIDIISVNLLLENDTDPVIWRGPIIAGAVKQFWTDVIWENVDFMFIDMPPGTGDVPLTVFQSIRVDGIIIVTSPQELVSMIVSKAVKMAEKMNIPIIGLVENMAYFQCPDCGKDHKIFGDSHIDKIARRHDLEILSVLPLDPELAVASDNGNIENYEGERLERIADILEKMLAEEIPARKAAKPAPAVIIEREGGNELKIAVASDNNQVAEHFGHCEKFNIYVADNGQIVKDESVPNPGHKPGFLPVFLHEQGVDVIISGGMGGGAIDLFNENNIEVIVGARGDARTAAEEYLKGELKSTGSVCHEHQHHDECGH
jgi:Mrp family chromosome partitioning ATPase/predicted Fe-Mo cluster-binding NifX family protein